MIRAAACCLLIHLLASCSLLKNAEVDPAPAVGNVTVKDANGAVVLDIRSSRGVLLVKSNQPGTTIEVERWLASNGQSELVRRSFTDTGTLFYVRDENAAGFVPLGRQVPWSLSQQGLFRPGEADSLGYLFLPAPPAAP